jgi:serine/threonine protein phosphatase 1
MNRTIIIGDVHGCASELELLLKKVEVSKGDELIAVGDLVRKGPDSGSVMSWAMETPNLRCVLGNHEARLLDRWIRGEAPSPGSPDEEIFKQLGDRYDEAMAFIKSWPFYLERDGFFVVHAGIDPRIRNLEQQSRLDLTTIRVPEGMSIPWYEAYTDNRLALFGHWARPEPIIRPNAIGLDTGCVYGGALTALILPERRLVSVPAAKEYQPHAAWN